jgi:glucosylceramidase
MPSGQTDPGLTHFSVAHDTAYIIPVLRQALALNPALKIDATPWSAPAWMKNGGAERRQRKRRLHNLPRDGHR